MTGDAVVFVYHSDGRIKTKYLGQVVDGIPEGEGTIFSYDKNGNVVSKYTGQFKNSRMHGEGTLFTYDSNGRLVSRVYGRWSGGVFREEKSATSGDGDTYTGEWRNGRKHGFGVYTWGRRSRWFGAKYIGYFENDKKSNQGSLILPSGDKYVGGFKNDRIHGDGVWYYADGSRFIGQFNEGKCESKGLKIWPDGTRYITAIDSYYHSEKNAYMPNADGDKYKTCTIDDRSKNGKATYTWEVADMTDKKSDDSGVEWRPGE